MNTKQGRFRMQMGIKRLLDLSISIIVLVFLSPFLAIIALAIKIDSPGGCIFNHRRIGKGGRPFTLYKFRSMVDGCSEKEHLDHLHRLIENEGNGIAKSPYRKRDEDPRVTRVGGFLRKFYLDELPQLWNVIKGDMSLVGPRPHVKMEVDHYTLEQRRRLYVRPGMTGLWQATGKADCTFSELIKLDLDYIKYWNLMLDFKIIFFTAITILKGGESFWAKRARVIPEKPYPVRNYPESSYDYVERRKPNEDDFTLASK